MVPRRRTDRFRGESEGEFRYLRHERRTGRARGRRRNTRRRDRAGLASRRLGARLHPGRRGDPGRSTSPRAGKPGSSPDFSRSHGILDFSPEGAARDLHGKAAPRLGCLPPRPRRTGGRTRSRAAARAAGRGSPPTARTIAFVSSTADGWGDVWTMKPDGTGKTRLTETERDGGLFPLLVARREGDRLLLGDRALAEGRPLDAPHPRRRDPARPAALLRCGTGAFPGLAVRKDRRHGSSLSFQHRPRGRPLRHA